MRFGRVADAEVALPLEVLLEYRAEARLDAEDILTDPVAAAAAGGKSKRADGGSSSGGRGWMSWLSSSSAPAAPSSPSPASPAAAPSTTASGADQSELLRQRFEGAKRGGATAVAFDISADLRSASPAARPAPPAGSATRCADRR